MPEKDRNYEIRWGWMYFPELNVAFFQAPRCASSTISTTLRTKYKHTIKTNKEIKEIDCFKFTFVRNPYDRFVSVYSMSNRDVSFEEFIDLVCKTKDYDNLNDIHIKGISRQLSIDGELMKLNFLGKFEDLKLDFWRLCNILGIEPIKLLHMNKTNHKNYTNYYTKKLKEKIYQRYKDDFINFGYKK